MRTRRNSVGLWLSDAELTHLRQQCQITGLNINTYLRKLIMGEHLCPRPPDAYAALLRELSAIGNNINQIAMVVNSNKAVYQSDVRELKKQFSELSEKLNEHLKPLSYEVL